MGSIRKEIVTKASAGAVWPALKDVGALHTKLVPGFVVDTRLEPGERVVTFGNGMVVREKIIAIDDAAKRVVWSVVDGGFTHHNGSAQVIADGGGTKVVWIADYLPDEAGDKLSGMMDQGMAAMQGALDRLA